MEKAGSTLLLCFFIIMMPIDLYFLLSIVWV